MLSNIIIASRILNRLDTKSKVTIDIFMPTMDEDVWQCTYQIRGDDISLDAIVCGEDSMQSIMLCFDAVRKSLDELPYVLSWVSDKEGDIGIPYILPIYFGFEFQKDVEAMVKTMVNEKAKQIINKGANL